MTLSCEIERLSESIATFWIKVVFRLLRPTRLANEEKQKTEHQSADLHVHNVRLTGAHRFLSQLGRTHNGSTINRERCVSQPGNRTKPMRAARRLQRFVGPPSGRFLWLRERDTNLRRGGPGIKTVTRPAISNPYLCIHSNQRRLANYRLIVE